MTSSGQEHSSGVPRSTLLEQWNQATLSQPEPLPPQPGERTPEGVAEEELRIAENRAEPLPRGVTVKQVRTVAQTVETHIALTGGLSDDLRSDDRSELIFFHLVGIRPVGIDAANWRGIASAAIDRLRAVIAELERLLGTEAA